MSEGYRTQSEDTDQAVERMLIDRWRAMSVAERAHRLDDILVAGEEIALHNVRIRHGRLDAAEERLHLAALHLDQATLRAVYGRTPESFP